MAEAQGGAFPLVGMHWGDFSVAEDVTNIIYQLTPEDTPVFNTTGDTRSSGVLHQWQTRAIGGRTHNAQAEGAVYAFTAEIVQVDARRFNVCQNMNKNVRVSSTQVAIDHYAINNTAQDQMTIRGTELKMDIEHAMINGTVASGSTVTTARKMQGLINAIVSGVSTYTTYAAGVSLSETFFNDHIQTCWSFGSKPADWYSHGYMRRKLSGFTSGNTKVISAEAQATVNTQSVYDSDFFRVKLHLCRDVPFQIASGAFSGYTGYGLLGLDTSFVKKAWLQPITAQRTAKVASSIDGVLETELCIEWGHPNAHFYLKGAL